MLNGPVQPVEHVKIGRYVFPLYSNPLLRRRLQDDALLQEEVERRLHNPRLQQAVEDVVRRLLHEGVADEKVGEETVAAYLEEALARLDDFFTDGRSAGSTTISAKVFAPDEVVLPALQPSLHTSSSLPSPSSCRFPPVRRVFPSARIDITASRTSPHSPRRTLVQAQKLKKEPKGGEHVNKSTAGDMGPLFLMGFSGRRLIPSCYDEEEKGWEKWDVDPTSSCRLKSSMDAGVGTQRGSRKGKTSKKKNKKSDGSKPLPSRQPVKVAPPEWRSAVRSLFYSMLSLHLEECGAVEPEEMDLHNAAHAPLQLRGSETIKLGRQAFAALDVTLDGNTYPIHCRPRPVPSILQQSQTKLSEKPIKLPSNALRKKVMCALAWADPVSVGDRKRVYTAGATLNHEWVGDEEPSYKSRMSVGAEGAQLEFPDATCRSRVLTSILKKINVDSMHKESNEKNVDLSSEPFCKTTVKEEKSQKQTKKQKKKKEPFSAACAMSKAPKKRGLSMEEKVERIEEWFISHPTPYTLKDLLLAIPKSTGVIPQSVEECLELLVSEDRVCQKKVGQHVLFWRFPKTAAQQITATFNRSGGGASVMLKYMNTTLPQIQSELKALAAKEKETRQRIQDAHAEIGDDASVHNDVMRTRELQDDVKRLQLELERLSVFDPLTIEKVKSATNIAWEAANRWTDNMYLLEHYILQRMGITTQELRARLQLPAEIDYIEFDELSIDKNAESKMVTVMPNRILSPPPAEANVHEADEMKTSPLLPAAEAACAETRAAEEEEAAAQRRGRKKTPATVDTAKRGREDRGDNKNNNDNHAEKRGEKESLCGELVEDAAQPPSRRRYRKKKDV